MRQFAVFLMLYQTLALSVAVDKCIIDNRSLENMWEYKLVRDLKHCSRPFFPPPHNGSEHLNLTMGVFMKNFKFYSEQQKFSAMTITLIGWQDDRLKWDPSKYDGISKTTLMSYRIWTPEIMLINDIEDDNTYYMGYLEYVPCEIESYGLVMCVGKLIFNTQCVTDLTNWPYDEQSCKLQIEIDEKGTKLWLNGHYSRVLSTFGTNDGSEWKITGSKLETNQTAVKQLTITLRLERYASSLSAIVVYPSYILSALTLSSLLIDARRDIRLVLLCFSLMCHFYFLSELSWNISKHSIGPPTLLLYNRGSFIMTSLSIVLNFVLNIICNRDTSAACPNWMATYNDYVYKSFIKIMIWPRWQSEIDDEDISRRLVKGWTDFANFINTFWIIVSVIVYVSMYSLFMPHPLKPNNDEQFSSI